MHFNGTGNTKYENRNSKWFEQPFDRLAVLSEFTGLTTQRQSVESLMVERVEGQITMTEIVL